MKELFTSYYARSGKRPGAISISAKSPYYFVGPAQRLLAPSWALLDAYKSGEVDAFGYTEQFGKIMKERNLTPQKAIDMMDDKAIMLCFEGPGKFCHRHIVAVWINNSGLATVCELNKDGSPASPTTVDDLIVILENDATK